MNSLCPYNIRLYTELLNIEELNARARVVLSLLLYYDVECFGLSTVVTSKVTARAASIGIIAHGVVQFYSKWLRESQKPVLNILLNIIIGHSVYLYIFVVYRKHIITEMNIR